LSGGKVPEEERREQKQTQLLPKKKNRGECRTGRVVLESCCGGRKGKTAGKADCRGGVPPYKGRERTGNG